MPNFEQVPQAVPVKRPSHPAKNVVLIITVLLFVSMLLVIFATQILSFVAKDIGPIDDADLRLEKVVLTDADNGYFDLEKIDKVIYFPKDKTQLISEISDGKVWDEAFVAELLSKNEESLSLFATAASKLNIQYPASADPANLRPDMLLPSLSNWRSMTRVSSIKSLHLLRKGKNIEAMDESLNSVKIGQKIQDPISSPIEYLVGIGMKNVALKTAHQIITSSSFSLPETRKYIEELEPYIKNETGLAAAFKAEYATHIFMLDNPKIMFFDPDEDFKMPREEIGGFSLEKFNNLIENDFYFQINKTKKLTADLARIWVKRAHESCGIPKFEPERIFSKKGTIKTFFDENIVGEIVHDLMAVSLDTMNIKKCEDQALVAATQVLLALKSYKDATKKLPMTLQELVPTYISSIPIDPFDKKPLKYSLSDKKIYSIHASSTFPIGF